MKETYALVTGASKGIGREVAIQLAAKGYHLLLAARSAPELKALCEELSDAYQVEARYFACDLSVPGAAAELAARCKAKTSTLSVLVNNAGFGVWGGFSELKLSDQTAMLQLNINAVVELSHLLLPLLKEQRQSYILNVCSTAAYQAMPAMTVYAATKAFVLSFSRGLRYELRNSNVSVTCLSPGPTETGFASRAGLDMLEDLAKKFNMQPGEVARAGLKAMFNKKAEAIPGFLNKVSAFGATHLPKTWIEKITANIYNR